MWLIVVDAKSKWPEVISMNTTTAERTIEKLKDIFAIHGLPEQIVVDNGPQFIASEFKSYCERRGIELTFIPPYQHNSNGEAERFVQTFKKAFYKGQRSGKAIAETVRDLLFEYRVKAHPATGKPPAEMLMGRPLRTTLDIVKTPKNSPNWTQCNQKMKTQYDKKAMERDFKAGQQVYLRNYTYHQDKWIPGIITERVGSNTYKVITAREADWRMPIS